MVRGRYFQIVVAAAIVVGCSDVTQPDGTLPQNGPRHAVHVQSVSQLRNALRSGRTWIIVDEPIVFYSAADRIVIDDECAYAPYGCPNTITIEGGGNWDGAAFYRKASFPEPLIEARHTKDWEFRLKGLIFNGEYHSGPALNLEYAQSSIFEDIRFQAFDGPPFILGCKLTNYPSNCRTTGGGVAVSEFRDIMLAWNNGAGEILNVSSLKLRGITNLTAWNIGWGHGLRVIGGPRGPNSIPGPVLVENVHMNGGELRIGGADKVTFRGGFLHGAFAYVDSSMVAYPATSAQCDGIYSGGSWLKVSGAIRCL